MNKKVLTSVLLGFLAVLLVVGLIYQFTPNVGSLFGKASSGTPAVTVNGQTVIVEEIQALQRSNQVLSATTEGILGDDLKTVAVESRIENALLKAASSDENISRAEVNDQVDKVRKSNSLTDNKVWVDRLAQIGFTDSSYREEVKSSLAIEKKQKSIVDAAPKATEAQLKQYYSLNRDQFQDEARIIGREIVVADKAKADSLLAQLKSGSDFAALARENSSEFKDRGGALGPVTGGKPAAVAQAALPPEVSAAAFALTGGGLTNVISSGGKFYIVKVEQFVPAASKPYESVKKQITDKVNQLLQTAAAEKWFDGLRKAAKIDYLLPAWKINNPTVATVGGQDILYSDVLSGVVGNQQFASLLQQVPANQAGSMVNQFLKPGITEQLIEQYAAPSIMATNKLNLVGNRANLAQQLSLYGSRDASVSDQDVIKNYQQNIATYTTKASATLSEAVFTDRAKALAFRQSFDGKNFVQAASKAGGTVSERSSVTAGDAALSPALSKAIFDTASLRPAGEGSVSDVIENGKTYSVAYVTNLVRANVRPLKEVEAVIRPQLLAQKRAEAGQAYLKAQMKDIKVDNKLSAVLAAQEKRIAAAAPKSTAPATPPLTTSPVTTPPAASSAKQTPPANAPAANSTSTPATP